MQARTHADAQRCCGGEQRAIVTLDARLLIAPLGAHAELQQCPVQEESPRNCQAGALLHAFHLHLHRWDVLLSPSSCSCCLCALGRTLRGRHPSRCTHERACHRTVARTRGWGSAAGMSVQQQAQACSRLPSHVSRREPPAGSLPRRPNGSLTEALPKAEQAKCTTAARARRCRGLVLECLAASEASQNVATGVVRGTGRPSQACTEMRRRR